MTDRFAWLPDFVAQLKKENILLLDDVAQTLAPAQVLAVDVEDWGSLAREAAHAGLRWCTVWAEDRGEDLLVSAGFEKQGGYLVVRTQVSMKTSVLPSHTPHYIGADRALGCLERYAQEVRVPVAVVVAAWYRPGWQTLRRIRPVWTVVDRIENSIAV